MMQLTIGDLAKQASSKVETIRYYERIGLLPTPKRTQGNYRSYDKGHVALLRFIRRARDLGFSLDQIRGLLTLANERDHSCKAVDVIARQHLVDIERKIADLTLMRNELSDLLCRCHQGTVAECLIIETLGHDPL